MNRLTFKDICKEYLNITDEQDMLRFFYEKLCYDGISSSDKEISPLNNDQVRKQMFARTFKSDGAAQRELLKFPGGTLGEFFDNFDVKKCTKAMSDIDITGIDKLRSDIKSDMIGFELNKNNFIYEIINRAFKRAPHDGLALCLLASLYPCDYTDEQSNEVRLRPGDDYSYRLVRLIKKYKRMLANEKFAEKHALPSIITAFRKESERINIKAEMDSGRFIPVNFSEKYPRINEMTLPFFYENTGKKDLTLEEVFREDPKKNILVTGPGGCGKTFSLIGLADSLLDDEGGKTIPVYVQLNDYKDEHKSLLDHVCDMLFDDKDSELTPKKARKKMSDWIKTKGDEQLLFLLDGFNELSSKEIQSKLVNSVRDLAAEHNDNVRFIITSRYDIKSYFPNNLRFPTEYPANELSFKSITNYIDSFFAGDPNCAKIRQNALMPGKNDKVKEFLRTPMALIMYCLINSPGLQDNPIKDNRNDDCQTYGELMDKYVKKIKTVYEQKEKEKNTNKKKKKNVSLSDVEKLLQCAGYYMSDRGVFNILPKELKDFLSNAGLTKLSEKFDKLKEHAFFKDVIKYEKNDYLEFIHQNYRDFFAASFLQEILIDSGVDKKNTYFGNNIISQEVMTLLADIMKEYRYKDGLSGSKVQYELQRNDSENDSKILTSPAISQIIRIAATGRDNDLSFFDFSGLDLSNTSLNGIKLYKNNNIYADFKDAVIKKNTLNALGHPGAIFSMLWIEDRYLVSFSKLGFFCFDMTIRKHSSIRDYDECAVRAALCPNDEQFILTGDDAGKITLWKYGFELEELTLREKTHVDLKSGGSARVKVLDMVKFDNKIYVSTEGGEVWSLKVEGDDLEDLQRENIRFNVEDEKSKSFPCRLTAVDSKNNNNNNLYCSFGNIIKKISKGGADVSDYYKIDEGKIIDIAAVNFGFGEVILVNIDNGDKGFSKVIAVKNQKWYPVTEKGHEGRTGFKGWNSFSEKYKNEVYLAANIEDSPESAGLLKISYDSENQYSGVDYYGNNHSMSVNCAVCFKYKDRNYIATGSTERSVEILAARNTEGTILYHLDGHDNGIHYIDIVSDTDIYAAHYSGEVSQWHYCGDGWRCMEVWAPHKNWVWECRHIGEKGTGYIISCSYDKKLSVINEKTGEITLINKPISRVLSFGFLSDDTILTGYNDTNNKTVLHTFKIDYSAGSYTALEELTKLRDLEYDLRSIHTVKRDGKYQLLLCANYNKQNNVHGAVFRISAEHLKPEMIRKISAKDQKVVIRYIDSIIFHEKEIMACGGDYNNSFYVTVLDDSDERIADCIESTDGCSAIKLVESGEDLYFIGGNYSGHIYIYNINPDKRTARRIHTCDSHNDKILNIQYHNGKVYFSTLNGNVYSFPFEDALSGTAVPEKLFQAVSGLRCCYVDFTGINKESELTGEFKGIIGYYGKV